MAILKITIELVAFLASLVVVIFAMSQAWLAWNYWRSKKDQTTNPKLKRDWQGPLPRVLLQLPLYNERYVVERLLDSVMHLDYPRELLTIQVLDDSTDDTVTIVADMVRRLKNNGLNIEHVRRDDRKGFKAGALQEGLARDKSELVAIFDADFLPPPDFIKRIIGYFADPKVGMVQTRWEHLNEEYSLLTKLLSFGIDAHFSVEQGGRQATNSFINFNGTAGMWRRQAIDEAGGWHSDCLTEDLDLSFRTQLLGWRFLYIEDITTPSELPVEMTAIRTQQFRWTKGAAETGRKNLKHLWRSAFPFSTKVIGSFHMLNSLVFPCLLAMSLCLLCYPFIFGKHTDMAFMPEGLSLLVAAIAIVFTYWVAHTNGQFKSSAKSTGTIIFRACLFMMIIAGLGLHNSIAVIQGLLGKATPFVRTPKLNVVSEGDKIKSKQSYKTRFSSPMLLVEALIALALVLVAFYAWHLGQYAIIPSLLFFAAGYILVIYFTVAPVAELPTAPLGLSEQGSEDVSPSH